MERGGREKRRRRGRADVVEEGLTAGGLEVECGAAHRPPLRPPPLHAGPCGRCRMLAPAANAARRRRLGKGRGRAELVARQPPATAAVARHVSSPADAPLLILRLRLPGSIQCGCNEPDFAACRSQLGSCNDLA
ncbi:hypothetical protein SETIT_4G130700v2 [Setaria italica]|uniref:Uncharacterized protein n=1 Tax=Setaria italica TaxID=4555 RepID=A0A368QTU4_SETIT|nr:hypothetical protein SETIT_4G130700v2 [Setaria italica]